MRRLVCLLLALALPAPAAAQARLFTRIGAIWVTDPAFDLVSEVDGMPQVVLGGGWDLSDNLSLEVAYGLAGASAKAFEVVDASFNLHQFQGGARWHLPLTRTWRGLVRAGAQLELGVLDLAVDERRFGDTAVGLGLEGALGLELRMPLSSGGDPFSSSFALSLEAGYGLRPFAMRFDDLRRDHDEPAPGRGRRLAAGGVDVGTLNLSGPMLHAGAALRF